METRARFVLIGLFTILGLVGMLGFLLWLAEVQLDRTYARYDILLGTAAGLSQTAAVRYNGVDVGHVQTIALDRNDPALVRVRIEIFASTPVRNDTVATLESQGVTGVAFIALEGGSADAAPLQAVPPAEVPVIRSERSVVQDLMVTGPDLLAEATALLAEVRGLVSVENRDAISEILANLEEATGRIDSLATRAEASLSRVDDALGAVETSLGAADDLLLQDIPELVVSLRAASDSTTGAMNAVRGIAQREMPRISEQVDTLIQAASGVIATIDALARQIGSDPGRFLLGTETPEYRRQN